MPLMARHQRAKDIPAISAGVKLYVAMQCTVDESTVSAATAVVADCPDGYTLRRFGEPGDAERWVKVILSQPPARTHLPPAPWALQRRHACTQTCAPMPRRSMRCTGT